MTVMMKKDKIVGLMFCVICIFALFIAKHVYGITEHEIIKDIEIRGLSRIDREEFMDLICIESGNILDRDLIRQGIRRAFLKGIFRDIKVLSEPFDDGVRLIFEVEEFPIIRKIRYYGNEHIWSRDINRVLIFKKGEEFKEELIPDAVEKIKDFYKKRGYKDTEVSIEAVDVPDKNMVDINVKIKEGIPLIIKQIEAPQDVLRVMKTQRGDLFDLERLKRDMDKIIEHYKKQGYIRPQIGPYVFKDGILRIPVEKGPLLNLNFFNNKAIKTKHLREVLPFFEDGYVSEENIENAIKRIEDLYSSKGYSNTRVIASVERGDKEIKINFFIHEGKRVKVGDIRFKGSSISSKDLYDLLRLKKGKPFDANLLSEDIDILKNYYSNRGFLDMKVTEVRKNFHNGVVDIEYLIDEGKKTVIKTIETVGNKYFDSDHIIEASGIRTGDPFNILEIGNARLRIIRLYRNNGFADVRVRVEHEIKEGGALIKFYIDEGDQYLIGKVIIKGNRLTKPKIIRREFLFEEGDIYNHDRILKVKQALYRLGIFRKVTFEDIDTGKIVGGKRVMDLMLNLEESKPGSVELSLGYGDYEKFRGMIDINYRNLGGYNRQIGFKTRLSTVTQRFVLYFREPWLFNWPDFPFKAYIFREDRKSINIDTREVMYKISKFGMVAGIEKSITKRLTVSLNYEYSSTETKDVKPGVILSREDTGTIGIGSVSPGIFYDTRDNPFDPTRGSFNSVVIKFASSLLFSEIDFVKVAFKSAWFYPVYKDIVFASALRGGVAFTLEEEKDLPLIERYFLGGRTTVRGYDQDMLGPKGEDGLPTGGNIFGLINAELRIPLGRGFSMVTFVDGGNVWRTISDINEDLRYTAGLGLRYKTPVGPVRIDYGHKLSRKEGESRGEVHFSFGHAF